MSYETVYAALKRQSAENLDNSPEAVAERHKVNAIMAQVKEEQDLRYPEGDEVDPGEYIRWHEARVRELKREAGIY